LRVLECWLTFFVALPDLRVAFFIAVANFADRSRVRSSIAPMAQFERGIKMREKLLWSEPGLKVRLAMKAQEAALAFAAASEFGRILTPSLTMRGEI
jgi:hypothetical protein